MAFDTVVVGGGTAGSVVAARLAEVGSSSVALLEAGPDLRDDPPGDLRNGFTLERGLPDWGYVSDADGEPVRRGTRDRDYRVSVLRRAALGLLLALSFAPAALA